MTIQTVPYALQNASHSAALFRQAMSAPFVTGGIVLPGELAVSQQSTPNMSIILGPGRAKVAGTNASAPSGLLFTTQAMYDVLNDANLTLTIAAASATNPRIDAVYVQVQDAFYSGAANTAIAGVVTGAPNAVPVAPSIPSNAQLVATIAVGANVTSIVTANIAQNAIYVGPTGGFLQAGTLTLLNTVTGSASLSHATVFADPTAALNGDYWWTGSSWVGGVSSLVPYLGTGFTGASGQTPRILRGGNTRSLFGGAVFGTGSSWLNILTVDPIDQPATATVRAVGQYIIQPPSGATVSGVATITAGKLITQTGSPPQGTVWLAGLTWTMD